jgi:hypothetical protein
VIGARARLKHTGIAKPTLKNRRGSVPTVKAGLIALFAGIAMAEESWLEFSDDDFRRIAAWLPEGGDPRRYKLMPQIIREWAGEDIRQHFVTEPPAARRKRSERLTRLGKLADRLLVALDGLNERDRLTLAAQIGIAEGQSDLEAIFSEENKRRLDESRDFVAIVAAGGKRPLSKPSRGHPRNILSYLVMMDIAAIFEYLAEIKATRQVDRHNHDEKGPFRDFASAIWSILFASDYGLSAALKNWADGKKKYADRSPVMANIALRHPEWVLFDPF